MLRYPTPDKKTLRAWRRVLGAHEFAPVTLPRAPWEKDTPQPVAARPPLTIDQVALLRTIAAGKGAWVRLVGQKGAAVRTLVNLGHVVERKVGRRLEAAITERGRIAAEAWEGVETLTERQVETLQDLARLPGEGWAAGRRVPMSRDEVSGVVAGTLVERGFAEPDAAPTRRTVFYRITPAGRQALMALTGEAV